MRHLRQIRQRSGDGHMTVSAHDVARELRHRSPLMGILKMHKLLYYCQGWFVAWSGRPMFDETIQAWENGPVVADLWHDEDKGRGLPEPRQLDEEMHLVIDYVMHRYGNLSGRDLVQLTHSESPWDGAYKAGGYNAVIPVESIAGYFSNEDDQVALRSMAHELIGMHDLQRILEATSAPSRGPIVDDTERLAKRLAEIGA